MSATHAWRLRIALSSSPRARVLSLLARATAAAALILLAAIHVTLAPMYGAATPYIGVLFIATAVAAVGAAVGILLGVRFAWVAGVLVAAGTAAALIAASTIGLPSFSESLAAPFATDTLLLDALVVAVYVLGAAIGRSRAGV